MQAFLKGGTAGLSKTKDKPSSSGTSKTEKEAKTKHIPWVEKYRPRCIKDVAYQDEVVLVLNKSLEGSDLPNLLFYGPPGTGKTSTILAAARDLFGPEMFRSRVLELNASDERGIDVVRNKVKSFSMLTASGTRPDGKPCPPFKIVILDEADSMTAPAQAALRRTMEKESRTTRFCLICNYVSRIIEPITSRCAKFRFKPLSEETLRERLHLICEKENVTCDEKAIKCLIETSEGDLRKAITYLQSASRLKGDENVTEEVIWEIAGVCPETILQKIMKTCHSDSYEKLDKTVKHKESIGNRFTMDLTDPFPGDLPGTGFMSLWKKTTSVYIINEGFSATQVLTQLHDEIVTLEELSDHQKSAICEKMAIVDKCLMDGADEYLQLMALFSTVMEQICHHK